MTLAADLAAVRAMIKNAEAPAIAGKWELLSSVQTACVTFLKTHGEALAALASPAVEDDKAQPHRPPEAFGEDVEAAVQNGLNCIGVAARTKQPTSCDDPTCGCTTPAFTTPLEALQFLSARFKHAGVSEGVAKAYARDIDAILAAQPDVIPVGPEEEAAIDQAAGLSKITLRLPIDLANRLKQEAAAQQLVFPAYLRALLTPKQTEPQQAEPVVWRTRTPYGDGYSFASEEVMRYLADWLARDKQGAR